MAITDYSSRSTLSSVFKVLHLPRLRKQYYNNTPIATRIKRRTEAEDFNGSKALIAAHVGWSEAVGAGDEGDKLPDPYFPDTAQMEVDVARQRGRFRIDRLAIAASRRSVGAWVRSLRFIQGDMRENMIWDISRQLVAGDGTGLLATLTAQANSGQAVVKVDDTKFLRKNMSLAFYSGATEQDAATTHRIDSVDSTTQITLAANLAANISNSATVYRKPVPGSSGVDTKDKECMGLKGIVDDGTILATFQNINRTTAGNEWLQSQIADNGGVNRPLTLKLMNEAIVQGEKSGGGGWPTGIYAGWDLYNRYGELLEVDKRFGNVVQLRGGFQALQHIGPNGPIPLIGDRMIADNQMPFVAEDDLAWWILEVLNWVDDDGAIVSRRADYDELEGYIVEYSQFGAQRCNRHILLKDVQ